MSREQSRDNIIWHIWNNDESKVIEEIIEYTNEIRNQKDKDEMIYELFSEVYDRVFYDIALKKSLLSLHTKKLLEALALPVNSRSLIKKDKLLTKLWKQ